MTCLSLNLYDTPGLAPRMNVLFWGPGDFAVSYSNRDTSRNAWNGHSGSFMVDTGILFSNMKYPLKNVKWHSDPWPTVASQSVRLSTNFTTFIPSLTFTDYEWFPWSICNGCGMPAGKAYPSGHLVPSPIVGLACAPIVETRFLELAMSLLDFSLRIPLGTFSILLDYILKGFFLNFKILAWLAFIAARLSSCKWNQPWHSPSQYPVLDKTSMAFYLRSVEYIFVDYENW